MYDVAVIGAGITGGMIARALSAYNLKICILEKENDVAMGATRANSAIVHAGFDAESGTLKARLNVKGSEMMERVAGELGVKYLNNGSLVVCFSEEDRKTIEELYKRGQRNGVKGLEILEKDAVKRLEANISDNVICALHAPTGAIVCPYELAIAATGNAMDNGAELKLCFEVRNINQKDGIYEIASENETVTAKYVVNAAGLHADDIFKLISDEAFEIHPRRGEYILLDKKCGKTVSHTIFTTPGKMGKGILVSPTVDGNLLLGPTSVDMEDKTDNATTSEGFEKIKKLSAEMVNGIDYSKSITSFCGLRAVGDTGDFIINSPQKGFVNVAGIESPGLSAAPAIAEYVVEILKEQGLSLRKKDNYNPYRKPSHAFREADTKEKNKIIKENPAYGKIVCRCESVTEGEILEAIRTNPGARDLDGVKRRTRAQMGRCQGGFCGPYITELISRELGIPYINVTKSGGKSVINMSETKGGRA